MKQTVNNVSESIYMLNLIKNDIVSRQASPSKLIHPPIIRDVHFVHKTFTFPLDKSECFVYNGIISNFKGV